VLSLRRTALHLRAPSLVEYACRNAAEQPDGEAFTFLADGEREAASLTRGELDRKARAIGGLLQRMDHRERALLLYPPGLDFIAAFFGCLYSGTIAVPAYPPSSVKTQPRLRSIVRDARPRVVLTTGVLAQRVERLTSQIPELRDAAWQRTDELPVGMEEDWTAPLLGPDTLAFLQYTSGSTATPRGVMVSHGNLLHNQEMIRTAFGQSAESVIVGWLPLYHDMGLIGNVLQPLFVGGRCILMSPVAFLQRPVRWLAAISRYRATTSGGPNFAYDLCARKIAAADREVLDLSTWSLAFNGAEPVRAETLERFAATFAPQGFDRRAFYPCYGLAEATLFVTGGESGRPPLLRTVSATALERDRGVDEEAGASGRTLVGCGHPWSGQDLLVVDPETAVPCAAGQVGEIWVAGPSVAQGYWDLPEETERVFGAFTRDGRGPCLRTGDLGFVHDGELFVTGRLKDLIILRGRNLYPQDLEATAERSHPALRPGCGAAFAVDRNGEERLVIFQEVEREARAEAGVISSAIRQAIAEEHEIQAYEIVVLPPGAVPKTSSGKVQRHASRQLYLAGELPALGRSVVQEQEAPGPGLSGGVPASWRALDPGLLRPWLENHLAERLAGILRQPAAISPEQPLTGVGLDSLTAIELQHALGADLGASIGLAELLEGASLRQVAEAVLQQLTGEDEREEPPGIPLAQGGEPAEGYPLSYGQRALWFLQRLQPESAAYNIAVAVKVGPDLDPPTLRRTFELLAERHEALRFSFQEIPAGPRQRTSPGRTIEILEEDASGWDEPRLEECLQQIAYRPFDLERDPLLRIGLFRTSAHEHTVVLAVHHLVADLGSLAILVRDLGTLYARLRSGSAASLPAPGLRYADHVLWQQQWIEGEAGRALWSYWRQQLAGELPASGFPTDRPRPPLQTFRGAARSTRLPGDALDRVKGLGRAHRATLFSTLLAFFAVLLHRCSGEEDLLVGSPTAGRGQPGLAELVGYLVNPVVLRSDLSGRPTFEEVLARVRGTVAQAFAHQDMPFPLLVEGLQPHRDPSRSPLFQIMFVLQGAHLAGARDLAAFALGEAGARMELAGLTVESRALEHRTAQLDLELMAAEDGRGLGLVLLYNSDLFDAATAERALRRLTVLLQSGVEDPARRIAELPLLDAAERHQLLCAWNDTETLFPRGLRFDELFAQQAERSPEALAAACGEQRATYRELSLRAGRLARGLLAAGLRPEDLVVVWAERGIDFLAAMLGIFQAGGAYLPVDLRQPPERLARTIQGSGARLILTAEALLPACAAALASQAAGPPPAILPVERLLDGPGGAGEREPRAHPGQLAYVLFTSGSTGVPKGVMIEHRGMLNHLWAKVSDLGLTAGDRVAQTASPAFDISVWQFLAALLVGGSVEILPDEVVGDPVLLLSRTEGLAITVLELVPALLRALLQEAAAADPQLRLSALRWIVPTGEALPPDLCQQWLAQLPRVPLLNAYGPTECSDDVAHHTLAVADAGMIRAAIGHPVANLRLYVLDRELGLQPAGIAGEICVGGAGVGRGYLGDAARTAAAFVPDPYGPDPGGRLYRTGDLGSRRPAGELDFLGRLDDQVKIRGFRVEPGEVESVLVEHPAVEQAVVLARPDRRGEPRLVAYCAVQQAVAVQELRDLLKPRLPDAMIPSAFVLLAALPLTPNGKVDRRALPAPEWFSAEPGGAPALPRDELEVLLADVFAAVLGLETVGGGDDFFALGGHSLLATQVMARLRRRLGIDLPLRLLFEEPTVSGLAGRVRALQLAGAPAPPPPLRRLPHGPDVPVSFGQQRLWFLHQLEPDSPVYNMPGTVRLRGRLRVAVLEAGLGAIVDRHESLRTTFREVSGSPFQQIAPAARVQLPVVDLGALPEGRREGCARRLAAEESRRPFDLALWPLFRARLVRLSEQEHLLLVTLHHIVSDGWSQAILVREMSAFYDGFSRSVVRTLPELPIQYADFAVWQRDWLQGEALDSQLAYWRRQLGGGSRPLELPLDRPRPPRRTYRGERRSFRLPAAPAEALRRLCRGEEGTLFMGLLALFAAGLARHTGQDVVDVGSPIANRRFAEVEGLIGFFVNTLVLRTDLGGAPSMSRLISRLREVAMGAYAHQDVPFERLVEELQPERDLSRSPLFQAMLVLQNAPAQHLELTDLALAVEELDNGTAKFELTLSLEETGAGLEGWIEHNTDLFDGVMIERFAVHLENLLAAAVERPEQPLAGLPLLAAAERHQLLAEWNDSRSPLPGGTCVHDLFAAQVESTPEAVALSFLERELTYAELDARADRLARSLRALGVGPEVTVGIFLERSLEMVIGQLAILKAGGAYLPLDPHHPARRLADIVADSGVRVVLSERRLAKSLPATEATLLLLDAGGSAPPGEGRAGAAALPENLAYVLFTSGSTGRPKGVGVTQRSLVNLLRAMAREPIALGGKTLFSVTTLSFDIGSLEILLPLVTGGKVVLVSREVAVDGSRLAAELARSQAEVMQATPATWRLLVEAGWQGARDLAVICGGEALSRELAARLRAGTRAVWNGYGPTETTIYSIVHPVGAGGGSVPIGRPVANTAIRLLDPRLEPVPAGVIGEICIGGIGVARGYVRRADLTAERFLPDAASVEAGARLYRTGDLGRYRQDGEIEYFGRLDHQVKVRGVRIEVAEIEVALEAHPAVRQAVVALHERSDPAAGVTDARLVAYLVAAGSAPPEPGELRAFLAERLPEPMLPSLFVPLETLPLTPSGKVNRGALPPPDFAKPGLRRSLEAPRNPTEEVLAGIWARVLGLEQVGIEESFFALGGHSLLATRTMSRVNETLDVQLALRTLFEAPTVAGLARAVAAARRPPRAVPPLRRVPRSEPPRASFAQERLWVMDQLLPGSPVYNVFQAIQLSGPLDLPALLRSLHEVVRRHEVLRTRFATGKGGLPLQVIDPPGPLAMPRIDLSALSREIREPEVFRLAREEARRPFSLRAGPLLRTSLLVLAADLRVMLLTMHHIVCDDWSVGLLIQEVAALYKAFTRALPSPLAGLPFQYADYAHWQREWLAGEVLTAELAGWNERLQGELPVLELPADRPRPPVQTFRGAAHAFVLPAALTGTLRELSLREGTTLFMTLLAGFAVLLRGLSGQEDLIVGAPVAGRNRRETEELIGFFVNVLPLRIGLSGRPSYRELLGRVRSVALAAYDHQDVPFEKLVEALQPKRDLSRAAIRQVGFALQDAAMRPVELGDGIVARPLEIDSGVARLDLTLFLWHAEEGLRGVWEYNTDLFDAATVARFAGLLQLVLEDMAAGVERPLTALPPPEKGASPRERGLERRRKLAPTAESDLTEGQLLFWFARKLQPEVQLYFDRATTAFTLSGELDHGHFARAFEALLGVCEVLRSRIHEADGVPRRILGGLPETSLEYLDFAATEAPEAAFREWLDERCRREMKLDERMFDTALARIGPRRFVWFFNVHHIIADAWSLRLIAHQLSHLYLLAQEGRLSEARPLPAFDEYVVEERAGRQNERYLRARSYWEEKLARPVAANLFYGRPGTAVELRTGRLSIELPAETGAGVGRLVARHGFFSPAVVFAGVLFALLFRLSGERRLRIGTPFANRPERHKGLVGLLMNACPLEVEVAEGETFSSLMKKLQSEIVAASRHQHYPVRNSVQQSAYDVYFNFQLISFTELCGLPVQFELLHSDYSRDHLHLQVSDFSAGGRFRLDFDFNLNLFDAAERERSVHHYLHLLAQTQADCDVRIEDAPLLSAAEREELVAGFNSTARDYPPGLTLHGLIEAQARRTPDAIAVSADTDGVEIPPLTYRELERRANQLAHFLHFLGVAPDSLVGVCMERSLEMVVALVGILKAGGAYVPLDPGYPAERLTYMLEDANASVLLTQSHLAPRLPAGGARLVALDTVWPEIAVFPMEGPVESLLAAVDERHLSYVIYTSGSTGRPKGAMLPHAGICNRLLWMQDAYGLTPEDRVLQKTPFSFDVSVWEFFWPLITGARLVMARPGGHQDPFYLVSVIARERITTLHFVPSMLQIFLEQQALGACDRVRRVICSGEALPDVLRQRFHERMQAELHNLYGPTEASVDVTSWQCEADSALPYVPIGRPIANTQIHLLDPRFHLVPRGIPGEICIGGVSLARGYLRRPDLTAERFVPDPFGGTPGGRLYRTGDLARLQPDGAIEFLGRIDHQVKIRGFRIELGEIESVLAQFPGVREAVLLAREDRPGDRRLVAYYVPEPSWGPTPAQLRGYLQSKLPEYMVPAAFVPLQAMPLTPSGKVHRGSLPPPETDAARDESLAVSARTVTESLIASICAEVLGLETVGVHDNFFALGGNSLMATQVVTMLQEVLPIEIDLRKVFEGPTVAKLAEVVEAERMALGDHERAVMAEILLEFEQAMEGQ